MLSANSSASERSAPVGPIATHLLQLYMVKALLVPPSAPPKADILETLNKGCGAQFLNREGH